MFRRAHTFRFLGFKDDSRRLSKSDSTRLHIKIDKRRRTSEIHRARHGRKCSEQSSRVRVVTASTVAARSFYIRPRTTCFELLHTFSKSSAKN